MRPAVIALAFVSCAAPASPVGVDGGGGKGDGSDPGSEVGSYLVRERFDAMATAVSPGAPWQIEATAGAAVTVRELPFATDKSVELAKPEGTATASLAIELPAQTGRVVFEAKVLARETAGFKAIPYLYDPEGQAIASIALHDGNLEARVGETITVMQPFTANLWYRVRVVVDTERDVFDLFVDGVRKGHDLALRAPADAVSRVRYYTDSKPASTLLVDNVKVYSEARHIGAPPAPVFDVRDFGAAGDGQTSDRAAIQRAIDAAAGTGGSVVLAEGVYLSGTLELRSDLTFFIAPSATLLGTKDVEQYPAIVPATGNTQLGNCKRALLYAGAASNVRFDGGGTIDGQGDAFSGAEGNRPMLIWTVGGDHVTVQNLYLKKGAVWSLVLMETDHARIRNVNVQSDNITHDGIDIVDGADIIVDDVAVRSGDDAMCLKTGVRRGIDGLIVRDSMFSGSGSNGGSNGIKFGTASYGAFRNITIEDSYVKDVQYAAMAVESRQGADVEHVAFRRIGFDHVGSAFFVYLAQQTTTHPIGDVPKLGTMRDVSFTDIAGTTASWPNSPHQGSLITGHRFDGTVYPIRDLAFENVAIVFQGGRTTVPGSPPEAMPNQYPESNMFGDLPAWAYYLRHVDGVRFTRCTSTTATPDVRAEVVTDDVVTAR
ncbi:MAG TPA: glycosyl hydrolase family 28-related protein [Kofleriaceae bacterium]|nr:glycosyl hydrolase family 28-related protein [Kofleriaceae bacterium]